MKVETLPLSNENGRTDRFVYAKVRDGDRWLFLKTAKLPELEQNLQRELLWADFVNNIAKKEPEARIRGMRMVGFQAEGGLLMEYMDAPLVASPSDGAAWKKKIDRYALMLQVLDKHATEYQAQWPSEGVVGLGDIDKVWQRWFGERYGEVLPRLERAREIIVNANLEYCVQHGDLTPWQIFEDGDEWVIFDGEKAGNHLPRYNDLAYAYGRLYTRLKDAKTATELLEKFISYCGVNREAFFRQFLPIMTFRATGMLADAHNDKTRENYVKQADELLDVCLKGEIVHA